jgi:PAS domain S-box-containing protein
MPNAYSADPYFVQTRMRSVLCMPLLKQARLIGVLYVENALAPKVFTPARTAVLKLLASQAATSLENARLFDQLRRSEERYALAVDAAGDGHTDWIVATDEFFASPRLLEMCGLPADAKFSGRADFLERMPFHPNDRARVIQALDDHYAGDSSRLELGTRLVRRGETRWMQITVRCLRAADGSLVRASSAITDVTERMRAEDALRQSEERFALAVAGANEGIFDWDLVHDRVYLSQRAQELFGLEPAEFWRERVQWQQMIVLHMDDADHVRSAVKAHLAGEAATYDAEFRSTLADGRCRWFHQRGIALRDSTGRPYRMVGSVGDVTDRKLAQEELLRLERRLRQAQRLEAMGTLAGGIAHDFNNILGAVLGFGERAARDAKPGTRLSRDLDGILSAAERGSALVDRILAFSRSSAGERVPVHVEGVVRETVGLLAGKVAGNIRIEADLRSGRAATRGDPTQLHQVLMNLTTNAVHAMPSGGALRIAVEPLRIDEKRLALVGNLAPGDYIKLTVSDTGTGMAPDVLERIFDPFFTTKDVGVGTGLGLSLVHGIIIDMEGAIDVTSARGEGTTFSVYLPRHGDAAEAIDDGELALPRGTRERVLVVDDEEALVRLATESLEDLGYVPLGFTSSVAALDAFRADPQRFDALLVDERMPGMTGCALIREVRGMRGSIPVVLMTGFVGGGLPARARDAGAEVVLKKPLSLHELANGLARVLQHP